jgi:hypothetical protein
MKTDDSRRDIPLVGVALKVMRKHPDGFLRYRDKADSLSALVNKAFEATRRQVASGRPRSSKPRLASLPLACLRLERSMAPATTKAGLAASSCSRMRRQERRASLALARSVRPSRTTNCCGPLGIDGSAIAADTLQLDLNLSREVRAVEGKSRGRVLAHWYSRRCVSDVQRDNLSGAFAGRARAFARFLSLYATQDEVMMMPNRRGHHTYSPAIRGRASTASSCWRSRCSASAM